MDQWNAQYRPAPQFEQAHLGAPPASAAQQLPDLEAMAVELDQMKIEAAIDSERTRPSLNGFFAFLVVGSATFIVAYVVRYGGHALPLLFKAKSAVDLQIIAQAIGAGVIVAAVVALVSFLATRRTYRNVRAFEQKLIRLGGTPLPDRGRPLKAQSRD
ncbi:MAG TPA: hypothetical protein VFU88_20615 [Ktedonobacterales bacterium]|nr:hypothetical protein [Ktedonobacterales bacterium]